MKTILLVDDEEIILMTLTRDLMKEGYEVMAVQSGHGAIAKLDQSHYDLVLTDLVMEGKDGIQVLKTPTMTNSRPRRIPTSIRSKMSTANGA